MITLLIDNYDSYTYIIFQYLWEVNGERPIVVRNNAMSIEALSGIPFDNIVISPGPGTPDVPEDVGLSMQVLQRFPDVPVLGICLGHQCVGKAFGAAVKRAPQEMHGKYSRLILKDAPLFRGLPSSISVVRYHSLIIDKETIPTSLECIAETAEDGLVMAVQHASRPFYGVQFHPESIGTEYGKEIFQNFKTISEHWIRRKRLPEAKKKPGRKFRTFEVPWKEPDSVFEHCMLPHPYAFWLDSSKPGYRGRFSFMGVPEYLIESRNGKAGFLDPSGMAISQAGLVSQDLFGIIKECLLKEELEADASEIPFKGGFAGYFGYESTLPLPVSPEANPTDYPESLLMWAERFFAFDHHEHKLFLCAICTDDKEASEWFKQTGNILQSLTPGEQLKFITTAERAVTPRLELSASQPKQEYLEKISRIRELLKSGDTYEVCLSNEFRVKAEVNSFDLYKILRISNPAPYSAYIHMPGTAILSSSPECFISADSKGNIRSEPIKGTRSKGSNNAENEEIRKSLSESGKEHSEILMIIDLIRNDLAMSCEKGSVRVSDFMKVTEYATLFQLSSVIEGRLREGITAIDVIKSASPGGSVTGAPKLRTMQIIHQLENRRRGVYTGSIGYLSLDQAADFNIAIRTMVNHELKGEISFGSGGAIIAESNPEEEYKEILIKAYALLRAIYLAVFGKFETCRLEKKSNGHEQSGDAFHAPEHMKHLPDLEKLFQQS